MCKTLICVTDNDMIAKHGQALWDPVSNRLYNKPPVFAPLARVPGSEDYIVVDSGNLARWKPSTDEVTPVGNPRVGPPYCASYSRNCRFVAGAFGNLTIRLGDASTLEWQANALLGHDTGVDQLDFSPDDKVLASGGDDGAVKLWDVATNQLLQTLSTVPGSFCNRLLVRFSPDGAYLVCGASQSTAHKSEVIIWPMDRPEYPEP
jgi:WD40 repeat protein